MDNIESVKKVRKCRKTGLKMQQFKLPPPLRPPKKRSFVPILLDNCTKTKIINNKKNFYRYNENVDFDPSLITRPIGIHL